MGAIYDMHPFFMPDPFDSLYKKGKGMETYEMRPRGLGLNWGKCFICSHESTSAVHDFASFVPSKKIGEAIVALFERRGYQVWLDFRPSEPEWIQVKVTACSAHHSELEQLFHLINKENLLTEDMLPMLGRSGLDYKIRSEITYTVELVLRNGMQIEFPCANESPDILETLRKYVVAVNTFTMDDGVDYLDFYERRDRDNLVRFLSLPVPDTHKEWAAKLYHLCDEPAVLDEAVKLLKIS